jgi:hypothetical protein
VPDYALGQYADLIRKGQPGDLYDVSIELPRRPRTTGPGSQNSHAHGHAQQIANETGHDMHEIETIVKVRALKRGYPYTVVMGMTIPKSQRDITTTECGYLIDEYHALAGELDIELREEQ